MLRSVQNLLEYDIRESDDTLGHVADVLFDDAAWGVRYVVVDTGTWLPGRQVLLAPAVLGTPDDDNERVPVALTREQVENSPDISTQQTVSRHQEVELHKYYAWEPYWNAGTGVFPLPARPQSLPPNAEDEEDRDDPHLRSVREVTGYHIRALDGELGHLDAFILDDEAWVIRYVEVETRNWLPGKRVLLAPDWIRSIDWAQRAVDVALTRRQIEGAPAYDPSRPLARDYEQDLHRHYERETYWE